MRELSRDSGDSQARLPPLRGSARLCIDALPKHGFNWQQGSTCFGGDQINAVTCVLAAIDLAQRLPWFSASVRDIRMLRIEELNDLMPAVQDATGRQP